MLAGIAQFERDLISERVKSGLAAAKARGRSSVADQANGRNQTGSRPMSFRPSARDEVTAGSPVTSESAEYRLRCRATAQAGRIKVHLAALSIKCADNCP